MRMGALLIAVSFANLAAFAVAGFAHLILCLLDDTPPQAEWMGVFAAFAAASVPLAELAARIDGPSE